MASIVRARPFHLVGDGFTTLQSMMVVGETIGPPLHGYVPPHAVGRETVMCAGSMVRGPKGGWRCPRGTRSVGGACSGSAGTGVEATGQAGGGRAVVRADGVGFGTAPAEQGPRVRAARRPGGRGADGLYRARGWEQRPTVLGGRYRRQNGGRAVLSLRSAKSRGEGVGGGGT